jgi:7-carboxy-7-deazaguanine synthase
MSSDKIINKIENHPNQFIVITGGEPMINPDLPELLLKLKRRQRHITIETAGIAFIPNMQCDLMSISPKLSNSIPDNSKLAAIHKDARLDTAVLAELIENYEYQLKFVVDSQEDIQEIEQTIDQIGNVKRENVMLMPQAATRNELIAKLPIVAQMCRQTGLALSQRLQILIWDNQRQK